MIRAEKELDKEQPANAATQKNFVKGLLRWNETGNQRPMPWKGEKNPYKIWLSEIMLQQTRVEQGVHYYQRFVDAFPTVQHLAHAPEQQVFKLWEGLGYYSRCKNLIATAQYITQNLNGVFPNTYEALLNLRGIGPYTAAAIGSFAYNLPYAVLDGNVFRVLSRIFDIETPIDTTEGKKLFAALAQQLLPKHKACTYNQAIMDFGATVCKPVPECAHCFFNQQCAAYLHNKQLLLPVKSKQLQVKERWFHYVVLQCQNEVALHQRTGRDIWPNLYEPLLIEAPEALPKQIVLLELEKAYGITPNGYAVISAAAHATQRLTHQYIHFSFFHLSLKEKMDMPGFDWVAVKEIAQYPFPKTLQEFMSKNLL